MQWWKVIWYVLNYGNKKILVLEFLHMCGVWQRPLFYLGWATLRHPPTVWRKLLNHFSSKKSLGGGETRGFPPTSGEIRQNFGLCPGLMHSKILRNSFLPKILFFRKSLSKILSNEPYIIFLRQELVSVVMIVHYYENWSFAAKWPQMSRSGYQCHQIAQKKNLRFFL